MGPGTESLANQVRKGFSWYKDGSWILVSLNQCTGSGTTNKVDMMVNLNDGFRCLCIFLSVELAWLESQWDWGSFN